MLDENQKSSTLTSNKVAIKFLNMFFKSILLFFKRGLILSLFFSFVLMPVNVILFYGFIPTTIHTHHNTANPFHISISSIWIIHLLVGLLSGMTFSKKRYLLTGSLGLLCAFLITGISFIYFSSREEISTIEVLIPLIFGILPPLKLYDFINRKPTTLIN